LRQEYETYIGIYFRTVKGAYIYLNDVLIYFEENKVYFTYRKTRYSITLKKEENSLR